MTLRRAVLTGTAGLVMVVAATAVAGCGSQAASSLSTSPSATSGSSGSNGAAASSSSASASAAAPTGHASSAAVNPNVPGGPPGCATRDLKATVGVAQGAAGSVYQVIDFTNIGTASCSLYGYPGIALAGGSPVTQIGMAASRSPQAACAGHPEAGRRREHAAADHRGAELPDVEVQPYGVDVPADLPAEPDHADLPGVQVNGMFGHGGEPADGERGAVRGWQRELSLCFSLRFFA